MFSRQLIFARTIARLRCNYGLRNTQFVAHNEENNPLETQLSDHGTKREAKAPFVKNLYLGKFDTELMTFPEAQPNDRYMDFMAWLKPIEDYITQCVNSEEKLNPDDVISHLKHLGVFRSVIDTSYNGLNCSETEIAKITETLSALPWLGTFFIKNIILPVRLIEKYGTPELKQKYLPGIAFGDIIPTIGVTEKHSRSSINSIDAHIIKKTSDSGWILNGEKNFVYNATRANLFLVVANSLASNLSSVVDMSLSVIEGKESGIACTANEDTVGLQEVPLCTVNFKDVNIPNENVILNTNDNFEPLLDILCPGRQNTGPQAVAILKSFLDALVKHILDRKHFDQPMYEIDGVKMMLSKIATHLYSMESMVYYTAALADVYKDQDVLAEKCITETYCVNECVNNMLAGLKLIGPRGYLRNQPFVKMLEDALSLVTVDTNTLDSHIYVTLLGLQHAGTVVHDYVNKSRNITAHPAFAISRLFKKNPVANLDLKGQLHPSMQFAANALEENINAMQENVQMLFERYGADIAERHEDLCRLTEIVSLIYASVTTLSRASRSYCIGLRNSTEERNLAVQLSFLAQERIRHLVKEIQYARQVNPDNTFRHIAQALYKDKGYFIPHALNRIT